MGPTIDQVRELALGPPRSYEADQGYNWVVVRLSAIEEDEMREIVTEAWRMVVPRKVTAEHIGT